MSAIVERGLDYFGDAGVSQGFVRLYAPQPDQDDWRCEYELEWPGYDLKRRVIGIDPWQAVQLAMNVMPTLISVTDDFKAGRIGIWGEKFSSEKQLFETFGVKLVEGPTQ